jgi:hypothetical protein
MRETRGAVERVPSTAVVALVAVGLVAVGVVATGCGSGGPPEARHGLPGPTTYAAAKRVVDVRGDQLLRQFAPGMTGIGVSTFDGKRHRKSAEAWVLLVTTRTADDQAQLPESVGAVPVRFHVSGVIRAQ